MVDFEDLQSLQGVRISIGEGVAEGVAARSEDDILRGPGRDGLREFILRIAIAQREEGAMRDEIRKGM
jgi:hypothetical protein